MKGVGGRSPAPAMPITAVARGSLEPPPARARHRDEPPLAAWTPEVRSCVPPKGTTEVPLDGAARGSGRTRAPARGATAAPPSLALVRTRRPRLLRCAARRKRRKVWVTDRSRRRTEQHMRAVRPGHGCSVPRWPVRTARRDERRRRRQHEREGREEMKLGF